MKFKQYDATKPLIMIKQGQNLTLDLLQFIDGEHNRHKTCCDMQSNLTQWRLYSAHNHFVDPSNFLGPSIQPSMVRSKINKEFLHVEGCQCLFDSLRGVK